MEFNINEDVSLPYPSSLKLGFGARMSAIIINESYGIDNVKFLR